MALLICPVVARSPTIIRGSTEIQEFYEAWLAVVAARSQSQKFPKLRQPYFCLAVPLAQVDDVLAASL